MTTPEFIQRLVEKFEALHKGYAGLTDVQIARVDRLYGLGDDEVGVVEGG